MEPSSFIHGQESVTVDPFDTDDPLRNRKELQETWEYKKHALTIDWWQGIFSLPLSFSESHCCSTVRITDCFSVYYIFLFFRREIKANGQEAMSVF